MYTERTISSRYGMLTLTSKNLRLRMISLTRRAGAALALAVLAALISAAQNASALAWVPPEGPVAAPVTVAW